MEFKSTKEGNSLDKMGETLFAKRGEWNWISYDIHEFNLALLAKQLWRLVQFPDSLVARVLRGKYYILSSLLRATSVENPSYVWKNIPATRVKSRYWVAIQRVANILLIF